MNRDDPQRVKPRAEESAESPEADLPHVEELMAGWGNHPKEQGCCYRAARLSQLPRTIQGAQKQSLLARGAGRAYGDAALNSKGGVVDVQWLDRFLHFNESEGVLRCEAGVTVDQALRVVVPRGWFLPVVPGTAAPTLGGLFAADVHGKNHHGQGSFQRHVKGVSLTLASGERVHCSRSERRDLFAATAGGMGLTGVIAELEIQLLPIQSSSIRLVEKRSDNLAETMTQLEAGDRRHQYSVAWVDGTPSGDTLGRGTVLLGDHAFPADLAATGDDPLQLPQHKRRRPPKGASLLLNDTTLKLFNKVQFLRAPREKVSVCDYESYFFPLDKLTAWNQLYGSAGFVQYQFVIPFEGAEAILRRVLETLQQRRQIPYLLVLKRFGEGEGMLSFPTPGWTLAADIPVRSGLFELLAEFDAELLRHGGRVYLAKDCCLSAESLRAMYPEWRRFLEVKKEVDPHDRFASDLSRRLELTS